MLNRHALNEAPVNGLRQVELEADMSMTLTGTQALSAGRSLASAQRLVFTAVSQGQVQHSLAASLSMTFMSQASAQLRRSLAADLRMTFTGRQAMQTRASLAADMGMTFTLTGDLDVVPGASADLMLRFMSKAEGTVARAVELDPLPMTLRFTSRADISTPRVVRGEGVPMRLQFSGTASGNQAIESPPVHSLLSFRAVSDARVSARVPLEAHLQLSFRMRPPVLDTLHYIESPGAAMVLSFRFIESPGIAPIPDEFRPAHMRRWLRVGADHRGFIVPEDRRVRR